MGVTVGEEHSSVAVGAEHRIAAALPGADSMPAAVAAEVRRKNGGNQGEEEVGGVDVGVCWHVVCMEVAAAVEVEASGVAASAVEALEDRDGAFEGCVEAWDERRASERPVVPWRASVVLWS